MLLSRMLSCGVLQSQREHGHPKAKHTGTFLCFQHPTNHSVSKGGTGGPTSDGRLGRMKPTFVDFLLGPKPVFKITLKVHDHHAVRYIMPGPRQLNLGEGT